LLGHADIVRLLASSGADVNKAREGDGGDGETALVVACSLGKVAVVRVLLEKGADAKLATAKAGTTPMLAASAGGFLPCVEALLEYFYDPSTPSKAGVSPLMEACERGHTGVVQALLAGGADRDYAGGPAGAATALAVALKKGHSECAALLRA
jgi:ankyrin repeat protein